MWLRESFASRNHYHHFVYMKSAKLDFKIIKDINYCINFPFLLHKLHRLSSFKHHTLILSQSVGQGLGWLSGIPWSGITSLESECFPAGFLWRGSTGESLPWILQVVGKIQFLWLWDCGPSLFLTFSSRPTSAPGRHFSPILSHKWASNNVSNT